jgi:hypothetical protein
MTTLKQSRFKFMPISEEKKTVLIIQIKDYLCTLKNPRVGLF